VRRLTTAYDTGDRPYLFTSYNAASGGTIVNQVQDAYNGFGQLTGESGRTHVFRKSLSCKDLQSSARNSTSRKFFADKDL
jgi:hypothetical protein